jgi:outer membrane protein assembly factor BamB
MLWGFCLFGLFAPLSHSYAQFREEESLSPEVQIDAVEQSILSQLQRAEKLFAEGQAADALDVWRQLRYHERKQALFSSDEPSVERFITYRPLSVEAQFRLNHWCRENETFRALVRSHAEKEAEQALKQAVNTHDVAQLNLVAHEHFATLAGAQATLLAGDAALAQGDYTAARQAWESLWGQWRVAPGSAVEWKTRKNLPWYVATLGRALPKENEGLLQAMQAPKTALAAVHPQHTIAPADVAARLVAVSHLQGDARRAQWEFDLFSRFYPAAQGRLGAERGMWKDLLAKLLKEKSNPRTEKSRSNSTFAGNPERNGLGESSIPLEKLTLIGSQSLTQFSGERDFLSQNRLRVAEDSKGLMSVHALPVNNEWLLCDGSKLVAYQATTGEPSWEVLLRGSEWQAPLAEQQVGVPRFTLSLGEGIVACTLPAPLIPVRRAATIRSAALSRIVGVDLETRKLVCNIAVPDATWTFGGSPVIQGGRLYTLLYQLTEVRPRVLVACYEIASGRSLWQQFLCSADIPGHGNIAAYMNGLLTLSHNRLYCNTNLGAVAAVACQTGEILWLTRYPRATFPSPRSDRSDRHFLRDLNPCMVYHDQVICMPADCERIFSLDALQGELLWSTAAGEAADAVHLLGASEDRVIASGDATYWIDALSGQVLTQFPAYKPVGNGLALPQPRGWGRGQIVNGEIYFSTSQTLFRFGLQPEIQGTFYQPRELGKLDLGALKASGGNLLFAGDRLLITTPSQLFLLGESR